MSQILVKRYCRKTDFENDFKILNLYISFLYQNTKFVCIKLHHYLVINRIYIPSDILKHTPKSNPDYKELEKALKAIKEVMTYINEDKRKTDGRIALFDIFNGIDNCPVRDGFTKILFNHYS